MEHPDGRLRVSLEALFKHVVTPMAGGTASDESEEELVEGMASVDPRRLGRRILVASPKLVGQLARSHGNLKRISDLAGVRRTTLIKRWTDAGLMRVWRDNGGRTLDRRRLAETSRMKVSER